MLQELHVNKHLAAADLEKIKKLGTEESPVIFAIIGDVSSEGKYAQTTIAVKADELIVFDLESGEIEDRVCFSDIEKIYAKRMYGNAFIRVLLKGEDKPKNLFRYTFSIAQLCDSLILFVNNVRSGENLQTQIEGIATTYEKQLSVCPKCGRTLSAPGVKCINCEGKRKIISRLAVYLKPEIRNLIISVFISTLPS